MIRTIHDASGGSYGAPRVHAELHRRGCRAGRERVARLMREAGLAGVSRRRGSRTTRANRSHGATPDRVERQFQADAPDRLWVADITYVPTWTGFLYLAIVLDVFSRKVVGWSMASHLRTELVLAALNMAIRRRCPERLVHHSDRGSQYTSLAFGKRCREKRVLTSTRSTGDCFANAMAKSFFATLECELLQRRSFRDQAEACTAIFEFMPGWYNTRRLYSALEYLSPNEFERKVTAAMPSAGQKGNHGQAVFEPFPIGRPDCPNTPQGLNPKPGLPSGDSFHQRSATMLLATAQTCPPNRGKAKVQIRAVLDAQRHRLRPHAPKRVRAMRLQNRRRRHRRAVRLVEETVVALVPRSVPFRGGRKRRHRILLQQSR